MFFVFCFFNICACSPGVYVNITEVNKDAENTFLLVVCVSHSSFSLPAVLRRARGTMKVTDVTRKQV